MVAQVGSKVPEPPSTLQPGLDTRLAFLSISVAGFSDAAPTESQYQIFERLKKQTDELLAHWDQVRTADIAAFQKLAADQGIHAIHVPDVKSERVQGGGGGASEDQ